MIPGSNPSPIFWIVMCVVLFGIPPLTAIGATYLFSKKFSVTAIFTAAMLYIPLIVYKLLNNFDSTELTVMLWGMPWTLVGRLIAETNRAITFFGWIGLLLNYLAVFALINFVHRLFTKHILK